MRASKRIVGAVGLAATLFMPQEALAFRPFEGTDAAVADLGEFELEEGPSGVEVGGAGREVLLPNLALNVGLAPQIELSTNTHDMELLRPGRALPVARYQDTEVGIKAVLVPGCLQGGSGPSLASELAIHLPDQFDDGVMRGSLGLILSARAGLLAFHANVAAARQAEGYDIQESLIIDAGLSSAVRPVIELGSSGRLGQPPVYSVLFGAIFQLSEATTIDAAMVGSASDGALSAQARIGLTWTTEMRRAGSDQEAAPITASMFEHTDAPGTVAIASGDNE
jgi:hypothetical protein